MHNFLFLDKQFLSVIRFNSRHKEFHLRTTETFIFSVTEELNARLLEAFADRLARSGYISFQSAARDGSGLVDGGG